MSLSFIICTHNRIDLLKDALIRFFHADKPTGQQIELLVIANACTDKTVDYVNALADSKKLAPLTLRCIEEPKPGKSYALNRAIAETQSDALCFLDDDQLIQPDFITNLLEALSSYPDYGIICGRLVPAWDGTEPTWVHVTGEYRIRIRPFPEFDLGETPKELLPSDKLPSGGNLTVRRSTLDKVGGFSVDIGPQGHNLMGGEDIDFVRRCLDHGLRIFYFPRLRQQHMILKDRMKTTYMMRKSYIRSYTAGTLTPSRPSGLKIYMFRKMTVYTLRTLTTFDSNRRFYFLMRLSAMLGEMRAAMKRKVETAR